MSSPVSLRIFATLASLSALASCAAPEINSRAEFEAEAVRTFAGIPASKVTAAAEAVIAQSDPGDVSFRRSLSGFEASRRYLVVLPTMTGMHGNVEFRFEAAETPAGTRASLAVVDQMNIAGWTSTTPYTNTAPNNAALFRLFWARVDYVLGRRPDWLTCAMASAQLESPFKGTDALEALCGGTAQGANAPAPQRL
jgi:hypothetical protein